MERTIIAKVTTSGQVSLPAPVRKRWRTAKVVIEDEGDRVVVRPLPDDPIAAACGSLKGRGSSEAIRARERLAEAARQPRPRFGNRRPRPGGGRTRRGSKTHQLARFERQAAVTPWTQVRTGACPLQAPPT
jgi:bifunctional DNA-binding transcriptional regulator/antitoxin component of YhaV-PrlF toxin-antitoxin module